MTKPSLKPCICDAAPVGYVAIPVPEDSPATRDAARNLALATQTYLSLEEAGRYTRRSPEAFRQWARRARLPKCRMGRSVLYRRRDIDLAIAPARDLTSRLKAVR